MVRAGRKSVIATCETCKTEYESEAYEIMRSKNFCSPECLSKHRKQGKDVSCATCSKIFYKALREIKKSKSGNHFCSRSCSAKFNNRARSK